MALERLSSGGRQPEGRSLLQCLRAHTASNIVLPEESDLAQGSRKAEPKARAAHTDALFWALIPDNRKGREERETEKDREPARPVMELLIVGDRGASFPTQVQRSHVECALELAKGQGLGRVYWSPFSLGLK